MSATLARLVRQVRRRVDPAADAGDSALLAMWVDHADENAFELLLWRHGPMVWQTCRRVLRHDQDAEDAFQASFLALARKASSIRRTTSVAGWLYRVALRAALAARARPHSAEIHADLHEVASAQPEDLDLRARLDEEIRRLPERYREAFVLCCLQGLTTDEAAAALNCPRGTVGTRVAWARRKLRERLGRDVPSLLATAGVPAVLVESVIKTVTEGAAPPVVELCREVMTMLFVSKIKSALTWLAPVLIVAVGLGGLSVTGARADKPAADKKKPAEDTKPRPDTKPAEDTKPKPDKKPADDNKPGKGDVQGVIKSVANEGKLLTIVTKQKNKNTDEETAEVKLTDKTQVLFFAVGAGETTVKEGQHVTIWFEDKSKDTAGKAHFHGDKAGKGAKPSLAGPISSVANDGKSFTIVVKPKNKNEDAVEQTVKITDKTEVTFSYVESGGAKLAKEMAASVWLAEGSDDKAARVMVGGKADLPGGKKGGEAANHYGLVSAVDKDGKSLTITESSKNKGEEPKKVELKLNDKSRQVFGGVAADGAKLQVGQQAMIWVDANVKDTVSVALFQAAPAAKAGMAGKVTAVADDGKSFTLLIPPTKKNEEGKEVTIKLADKARVIFNGVAPGAAKITKGYAARVELAENSKDTASAVTFGLGK